VKVVTTIDGKFVPREKACISVFDNALLYAEGLFETFLAVDDRVVFVDDHLRRLSAGLKVTGLKLPVDRRTLKQWMVQTAAAHPDHIKKLRLTITSGEAARWVGIQGPPRVILSASPHELPQAPYTLHLSEFRIDQNSVFRRIKTISYAIHAAALKQAKRYRLDDALLLNTSNQVAEVTSANILWVKRGRVFTPPISAGCPAGGTATGLPRRAPGWGVSIAERNCQMETLLAADEVFISSSLKVIVPVGKIKTDKGTFGLRTGPVAEYLRDRFYRLLRI